MIELKHLNKEFKAADGGTLHAVRDVSLTVNDGEVFGIIGFSGAGKSTLVRCINLLERPTSGEVVVNGQNLMDLRPKQLRAARKKIGMIFQQFNLLEQRSVLANVRYPMDIDGVPRAEGDQKALQLLETVGLAEKAKAYPAQLSGGQKQRVAIARALASDPDIILCDEATSALDPEATRSVLDLLKSLNQRLNVTIVVITHEMKVVEQVCDRVAVMADGSVQEQGTVREVFLHPRSETAKRLIEPALDHIEGRLGGELPPRMIRIAFNGEQSSLPVVSDLSLTCGVQVSIMGANTQDIGGHAFGQMLLQMPEDETACDKIRTYLHEHDIHFEEGPSLSPASVRAGDANGDARMSSRAGDANGDARMPGGDGTNDGS